MNTSGIVPVDVKVLVRPDAVEEVTKGGIYIPDAVKDQKKYATVKSTVVAVGGNAFHEWGEAKKPAPGDRVLTAQYAGARAKGDDGQEYVVCNDEDVIAILKSENQ